MIAVKQFVSKIQGKNSPPPPINFFLFLYYFRIALSEKPYMSVTNEGM